MVFRNLLVALLVVGGLCLSGCGIGRIGIYPGVGRVVDWAAVPADAREVWLEIEGGDRVPGWLLLGEGRTAETPGAAVVYMHGNAEVIGDCVERVRPYREMGVSVLLVEYRGFGRAGGSPSQAGIGADMDRFVDWLVEQPEVDPARMIYHGRSLGGGVALDLTLRKPPAALVLSATFTSMPDMFERMGWPGWLATDRYDNLAAIRQYDGPVLILHGDADALIPLAQGYALAEAAERGSIVVVPGVGHHGIGREAGGVFWRGVGAFIQLIVLNQSQTHPVETSSSKIFL
ncbi:alpha/beta hydrolase [Mucisphaera sp.]|uniref:alpha/beta hydrolase n=1 Tax=Mucisphaera sp. TaxID=2913024 RepID=UPI003D0D4653